MQLRRIDCLGALLVATMGVSAVAAAQDTEQGVEFSAFGSSFFGGDSGPTVVGAPLHPETRYEDTFGAGFGLMVQYFRQVRPILRWQAGLIHQSWPGKFFEGGEFQPGWAFGAGGRFDDLKFTGIYGGITFIRQPGAKLRPFASVDLAIAKLSKVDVSVSGESQPYWKSTTKDFLIMRAGVAYRISAAAHVTLYGGFSVMGEPESVDIFSSATAASSLVAGIGASYAF